MRKIRLTQGLITLVDDDDFGTVSKLGWYTSRGYNKIPYALTYMGNNRRVSMHRFIMRATSRQIIDHINGNTLDNRKNNLRIATKSQNAFNSGLRKNSTTGYKGVTFKKANKKYVAQIGYNGRRLHIGMFDTPTEAAKAYDAKAKEVHGEFARVNI